MDAKWGNQIAYCRTRIHGQEEATVFDLIIQINPIKSWLHHDIHATKSQPKVSR